MNLLISRISILSAAAKGVFAHYVTFYHLLLQLSLIFSCSAFLPVYFYRLCTNNCIHPPPFGRLACFPCVFLQWFFSFAHAHTREKFNAIFDKCVEEGSFSLDRKLFKTYLPAEVPGVAAVYTVLHHTSVFGCALRSVLSCWKYFFRHDQWLYYLQSIYSQ